MEDYHVFSMDTFVSYEVADNIWGGQLQKYRNNEFDEDSEETAAEEKALGPIVALLRDDMFEFAEEPKEIKILNEAGKGILAGDDNRRFFEASWVHKCNGNIIFLIQQEIHILTGMRLVKILTAFYLSGKGF